MVKKLIQQKDSFAVEGQQPFGGARASGTNDKAGSSMNLMRWVSVPDGEGEFQSAQAYEYPFMEEE